MATGAPDGTQKILLYGEMPDGKVAPVAFDADGNIIQSGAPTTASAVTGLMGAPDGTQKIALYGKKLTGEIAPVVIDDSRQLGVHIDGGKFA